MEVTPRELQVDGGLFEVPMPKQDLNRAQVGAGFEQVRGPAVAQGLLVLLMICTQQGFAIGFIPSTASKLK